MTIQELLSKSYIIFSSVSHTDKTSFLDYKIMDENITYTKDVLEDLQLKYLVGTGVDNKENYIPYFFVDVSEIVSKSSFDAWQDLFALLETLGQEVYIRGFKTQSFLMGMRFSVLARVDGIVYHETMPKTDFFMMDNCGTMFSFNFKKDTVK